MRNLFFVAILFFSIRPAVAQNVGIGTATPTNILSVVGKSDFSDSVGIGISTPQKKLHVVGDALLNGLTIGRGKGNSFTNTAVGNTALDANTSGYDNTAVGFGSLSANTSGIANVATGIGSLISNTTGQHNTGIGYAALNTNWAGSYNTAMGSMSLYKNNGSYNTASGYFSMYLTSTGEFNAAHGYQSLYSNTTGHDNTAMGASALRSNGAGHWNTAVGSNALYNNTSGFYNNGIGHLALYTNTTGNYNNALGYYALYTCNGIYNVGVGHYALFTLTTGSNNVGIGYNSSVSPTVSNAIAIGTNANSDAANKARIGNASITSIGGQVAWTNFSDGRIKNNIRENVPGLAFIKLLKPVTYNFSLAKEYELTGKVDSLQWEGKYDIEKINFSGFVAQDVEAAAKKISYDFSGVDKTGKIMGLRYSEFVVPLVKGMQEQQATIEEQNNKIASQQKQIDELIREMQLLKQRIK